MYDNPRLATRRSPHRRAVPLTGMISRACSAPDSVRALLDDGRPALLRPLGPAETEPLRAVFDGLSATSRERRYLVGMTTLPPTILAALTDIDGWDHFAWLATVGGKAAGISRYVRIAANTAELAFEVVDAYQGRGLGSTLLDAVMVVADAHDITTFRATVQPHNTASLRLLRGVGMRLRLEDGLLEGEGPLTPLEPARVDRPATRALAARHTLALGQGVDHATAGRCA